MRTGGIFSAGDPFHFWMTCKKASCLPCHLNCLFLICVCCASDDNPKIGLCWSVYVGRQNTNCCLVPRRSTWFCLTFKHKIGRSVFNVKGNYLVWRVMFNFADHSVRPLPVFSFLNVIVSGVTRRGWRYSDVNIYQDIQGHYNTIPKTCLLYTSDAADE